MGHGDTESFLSHQDLASLPQRAASLCHSSQTMLYGFKTQGLWATSLESIRQTPAGLLMATGTESPSSSLGGTRGAVPGETLAKEALGQGPPLLQAPGWTSGGVGTRSESLPGSAPPGSPCSTGEVCPGPRSTTDQGGGAAGDSGGGWKSESHPGSGLTGLVTLGVSRYQKVPFFYL